MLFRVFRIRLEKSLKRFSIFFAADTDTTSYFLMMLISTAQNKEVEKKLREEIEKHMQDDDYIYENLKKMIYVDQIQKETTRLYGPAIGLSMKEFMKDHYLVGTPMKKGIYVNVLQCTNNFKEKKYIS